MAENHAAVSASLEDAITALDGSASSKDGTSSDTRPLPVGLPLRQALHHSAPQPKYHDITEKFESACSALNVGQLVKDEYFTLFESIGALEIMDPKMDSGFLQPGETLEDDYDTLAPLLPEEVIGIMDQLLCYEMAWHTGYPLSQTLLTSMYIDKLLWPEPHTFEQAQFYRCSLPEERRPDVLLEVLRAYCLALIKCCDFVIAKITGRDYFEEEDFCTHTYNRVLFVNTPMDVFLRELDAAVEGLEDTDFSIDQALRKALISRLNFRKDFLTALDLDCPLDHLENYWPPISSSLTSINTTHQLGKSVPGAFSTKLQRRLASTVPPRPIVELSFPDAFSNLKQLCLDCSEATRFTTVPPDPLEYQSFLWAYSSRSPTPLPYSRSYLATLLFHPTTLNASTSFPLSDLRAILLPASPLIDPTNWTLSPPLNPMLPKPPRIQFALLIDEFIDRVGAPYLEFWTALGQNRCRLRRLLGHVILAWDQLQSDAGLVDEDLHRAATELGIRHEIIEFPLSSWTYAKKLWMVEKMVLLGFEQDIYLPDEFAAQYSFLSSISARRREVLSNIVRHLETRHRGFLASAPPDLQSAQEVEDSIQHVQSLLADATGISALADALSRFYTLALYLRLLPFPTRPFSTETLRYELRMKPFLTLQPPEVLPFDQFVTTVRPFGPFEAPEPGFWDKVSRPDDRVWGELDMSVKTAKEAFAKVKRLGARAARAEGVEKHWAKEIQGALASCVALGVAVAGVRGVVKGLEKGSELGVRVEVPEMGSGKRYAEGWVVGRVVKK